MPDPGTPEWLRERAEQGGFGYSGRAVVTLSAALAALEAAADPAYKAGYLAGETAGRDDECAALETRDAEPEPAAFIHEGEDCTGPVVHVLRVGDSVTIQVTGQANYHVRLDPEDELRPEGTDD